MDTPASLTSKRIGCIGCGNMGGAILGGLAEVPGLELYGYNRTPQRLEPLCAKGVTAVPDIPGIAARCDILVIGVKPYLVGGVLAEALPSLKPETVVISIAAGVTLHDLRDAVQGRCHVVRVMPNTPALVGAGVFGIQEDPALPKDVFAMILDLFGLLGSTIVLPEKKFNARQHGVAHLGELRAVGVARLFRCRWRGDERRDRRRDEVLRTEEAAK